jgi:hypothetical protein
MQRTQTDACFLDVIETHRPARAAPRHPHAAAPAPAWGWAWAQAGPQRQRRCQRRHDRTSYFIHSVHSSFNIYLFMCFIYVTC